jgi:hypothetical protein
LIFCFVNCTPTFNSFQERFKLLNGDTFLKNEKGVYFTNPMFHELLNAINLIGKEVTAPKMAFVIMKVVQYLCSEPADKSSMDVHTEEAELTSSFFIPGNKDEKEIYKAAFTLVMRHEGKHFAVGESPVSGRPAMHTLLRIVVPPEVRSCDCAYSKQHVTFLLRRRAIRLCSRQFHRWFGR